MKAEGWHIFLPTLCFVRPIWDYENYWYPHGGANESEKDKVVCELMIKF